MLEVSAALTSVLLVLGAQILDKKNIFISEFEVRADKLAELYFRRVLCRIVREMD